MKSCEKIFVLGVALFSAVGCSVDRSTSLKQQVDGGQRSEELSNAEKQTLKGLLALVFKDPGEGKTPMGGYQAYLSYQSERQLLEEKNANAKSDLEKRIYAQRLTRLDDDFASDTYGTHIHETMDQLSAFTKRLYSSQNQQAAFDRIRNEHGEELQLWLSARDELAAQIASEGDQARQKFLAGKLSRLEEPFMIRFLWLVANL